MNLTELKERLLDVENQLVNQTAQVHALQGIKAEILSWIKKMEENSKEEMDIEKK